MIRILLFQFDFTSFQRIIVAHSQFLSTNYAVSASRGPIMPRIRGPRNRDFSLINLRKVLGLGQTEMAERMGLSLRPYQELESEARRVRPRHVRLAESVALDVVLEQENLELAPANLRKKMVKLALMLVQQNLKERPLGIAKSILGQDQE
jgi:hypothetical protein